MIRAEIVADSLSPQGDRLISVLATFPRIILAEVNTHRMLSKNTSSSRAIPFKKMVETIKENPFIPIAWQEDHSGMQGTKYLDPGFSTQATTEWLKARDYAVAMAEQMNSSTHVTKQLCNRPLETYMWTTMLITGPLQGGWDNFFDLRCPAYTTYENQIFRSKKDYIRDWNKNNPDNKFADTLESPTWFEINKGQAEIHMMALAECIWDAINESTPISLNSGEWHIPFGNRILIPGTEGLASNIMKTVKISVAMAARTSYTIVGEEKEINFENMIALHDRLITQNPPHSSPMEHCARAMSDIEYETNVKGLVPSTVRTGSMKGLTSIPLATKGWCRNFRGFIPYRHIVESKNN